MIVSHFNQMGRVFPPIFSQVFYETLQANDEEPDPQLSIVAPYLSLQC